MLNAHHFLWKSFQNHLGSEFSAHGIPLVVSNNFNSTTLKIYIGNITSKIYYFFNISAQGSYSIFSVGISIDNGFENKDDPSIGENILNRLDIINEKLSNQFGDILTRINRKNSKTELTFCCDFIFGMAPVGFYSDVMKSFIRLTLPLVVKKIQANIYFTHADDDFPVLNVRIKSLPDSNQLDSISTHQYCADTVFELECRKTNTRFPMRVIEVLNNGAELTIQLSLNTMRSFATLGQGFSIHCAKKGGQPIHLDFEVGAEPFFVLFGKQRPTCLKINSYNRGGAVLSLDQNPFAIRNIFADCSHEALVVCGEIDTKGIDIGIDSLFFGRENIVFAKTENITTRMIEEKKLKFSAEFSSFDFREVKNVFSGSIPLYVVIRHAEKKFVLFAKNKDDVGLNAFKCYPDLNRDNACPYSATLHYDNLDRLRLNMSGRYPVHIQSIRYCAGNIELISTATKSNSESVENNFPTYDVYFWSSGVATYPVEVRQNKDEHGECEQISVFSGSSFLNAAKGSFFVSHHWGASRFNEKLRAVRAKNHSFRIKGCGLTVASKPNSVTFALNRNVRAQVLFQNSIFILNRLICGAIKKIYTPNIWLIGEDGGTRAEDNGYALFSWCMRNKIKENLYFVIEKGSANIKNLSPFEKNVVFKNSIKHFILYSFAQRIIGTHSLRDTMPTPLEGKVNKNKKRVCVLQHGYMAMKRTSYSPLLYNNKLRFFLVSSPWEKELLIRNGWARHPEKLPVLGLPRFDTLLDNQGTSSKNILFVPTWRDWHETAGRAVELSSFSKHCKSLLSNLRLKAYLEKHNMVLQFMPHPYYQYIGENIDTSVSPFSERIKIISGSDMNMQEALNNATILITDYSSVAFDFNYLKKNTIFYQFDFLDFVDIRGSYANIELQMFGYSAFTEDQVIDSLEQIANNDFSYSARDIEISQKLYPFVHEKNYCERTYSALRNLNIK